MSSRSSGFTFGGGWWVGAGMLPPLFRNFDGYTVQGTRGSRHCGRSRPIVDRIADHDNANSTKGKRSWPAIGTVRAGARLCESAVA